MNSDDNRRWVFNASVMDRAGALTSIASVFSNETVSINTIVGHGVEEIAHIDGRVVITFCCTEEKKDILVRKVKRLTKVIQLEEHPYESQSLRKSAIVLVTRRLAPLDVAGDVSFLTSELIKNDDHGWTYFLAGSPSELDQVLEKLETAGEVRDIVYSIIGL